MCSVEGFIYWDKCSKLVKSFFKSVNSSMRFISKVIIVSQGDSQRQLIVLCIMEEGNEDAQGLDK